VPKASVTRAVQPALFECGEPMLQTPPRQLSRLNCTRGRRFDTRPVASAIVSHSFAEGAGNGLGGAPRPALSAR
jgi:hypothetical protein